MPALIGARRHFTLAPSKGVGYVPPGFVLLMGADGALLKGADGAYLYGVAI